MKLKKFLLISLLCIPFVLFSEDFIDLQFGANLGDLGYYYSDNGGFITGSIGSINCMETTTGVGLNIHVWSLLEDNDFYFWDSIFESDMFIGTEFIWDPFYSENSIWGCNLFYRIDHIIKPELENWRTGIRGEYRFPVQNFTPWPIVSVEMGYWNGKGFYWGLKFDTFVSFTLSAIGILAGIKEKGEEHIPEIKN